MTKMLDFSDPNPPGIAIVRKVIEGDNLIDWRVWRDNPLYQKARRCDFIRLVDVVDPVSGLRRIEATLSGRELVRTWDQIVLLHKDGEL